MLTFGEKGKPIGVKAVVEDEALCESARQFNSQIEQGSFSKLCESKVDENANSPVESLEWQFLHALAENTSEVLLKALGFDPITF